MSTTSEGTPTGTLFTAEEYEPVPAGFALTKAEDIVPGDQVLLTPGKAPVTVTFVKVQGHREGFYRPKVYLAPFGTWWPRPARLFVRKAGPPVDYFDRAPVAEDPVAHPSYYCEAHGCDQPITGPGVCAGCAHRAEMEGEL